MVRFIHTSDWHLGRLLYNRSLLEDQAAVLNELVALIDQTSPHALVISGDVFDRSFPPEGAVTLFDRFLEQVADQRKLPVFLIPGNHDSCERLGFAAKLLRHRGVTIFARLEDALSPVRLVGDDGVEVLVYGIPFVEPLLTARFLNKPEITTPDEAIRALCRVMLEKKADSAPAVLLCHAFVAGSEGSESERDLFIGGSSVVDASAFSGFSYTALGHLHKPQSAGSVSIRYSGSLLAYSKSEVSHRKSVTEVCIDKDGKVQLQLHELKVLRALRYVEGELQELLRNAAIDPRPDDYIIAGYTDTGAVVDAYSQLRQSYCHLLHITRAGAFMPDSSPSLERQRQREHLTELELFSEFFSSVAGQELNDDEREDLINSLNELETLERRA